MSRKISTPPTYGWMLDVATLLSGIGENYDEPIFIEQRNNTQYQDRLESDSGWYVARNIFEKQMRYEEIDRYPTTAALRYGM